MVWARLAFASFGIITPVLSVVISVFMLGLALGSWLAGKYIEKLTERTGQLPVLFYALAELFIGIGGLLVPELLKFGQTLLLSAGSFNSLRYLIFSAAILSVSLFPWCFCMGMTIPLMLAFMKRFKQENATGFGFLYIANVIGAMCGAIFTAGFLIEWVGLKQTLFVAACLNFSIALAAILLNFQFSRQEFIVFSHQVSKQRPKDNAAVVKSGLILPILFITGFSSMAMEVVWVRAFTPVLYTSIYSFASILAVYLLATWVGSRIYYKHACDHKALEISSLIMQVSCFCFIPIFFNDPRILWRIHNIEARMIIVLMSIFPFCAALGYLTPKLIDDFSKGEARFAGKAYAINALGCILGPLLAGYLLLPVLGVKLSLVILAIPFTAFLIYYSKKTWKPKSSGSILVVLLVALLYSCSVKVLLSYEDSVFYRNGKVRRDYVASVVSFGEGLEKKLLVNGIGITKLTPITKFMAHLPLAVRRSPPDSALIICLGMGATFRSAASWGIRATAIELVPSVRDAFGFYFDDTEEILKNPKTQIIIDDGRRFLKRTQEKFDVITLDPPPPVYASGSSLLYSEEFYRIAKLRLKEGGVLQQWFPAHERELVAAVARSLCRVFPYVRIFNSVEGWGYHFIASPQPFEMPSAEDFEKRLPPKARADLMEWIDGANLQQLYQIVKTHEVPLDSILSSHLKSSITDDRPFNEYFLMRNLFHLKEKSS